MATRKGRAATTSKAAATPKIKIREDILDEPDLDIESAECCSLGQVIGVDNNTPVEQLHAARYEAYTNDRDSAVIATTNPQERTAEARLREAGFTHVATFPRYKSRGNIKLWFALILKPEQVEIEEVCDECGKPSTCKC